MDKEHVKGAIDNTIGKTKEVTGNAIGSEHLVAEGQADQVKGALHNAAGDVKDAGKAAFDNVKHAANRS
jgi:uncharacterized protein YjbJ (UPF0337 family)